LIEVEEILGRSEQGATHPFICRCSDDKIYFVKGADATRSSQVHEWIAAHMASEFGLPIAPFKMVNVVPDLASSPEAKGLGCGPAFGSQKIGVTELNYSMIDEVPEQQQRDVFAFDWWIKNEDRVLTETGGNPNLFWVPEEDRMVVIDHNLAFDPEFSKNDFLNYHVFRGQANFVLDDMVARAEYEARFEKALAVYGACANLIPEEWHFIDEEMSKPAKWLADKPCTREILASFKLNDFWRSAS